MALGQLRNHEYKILLLNLSKTGVKSAAVPVAISDKKGVSALSQQLGWEVFDDYRYV